MNQPEQYARMLSAYAGAIDDAISGIVECLEGLDQEQVNWRPDVPGANSLWVLAVHAIANAEQAVLAILGGAPDTRDREAEFAAHGASPEAARTQWEHSRQELRAAIARLSPEDLAREHTHPRRGVMTGHQLLLLVLGHAAEHRGHASLTRDLLLARS